MKKLPLRHLFFLTIVCHSLTNNASEGFSNHGAYHYKTAFFLNKNITPFLSIIMSLFPIITGNEYSKYGKIHTSAQNKMRRLLRHTPEVTIKRALIVGSITFALSYLYQGNLWTTPRLFANTLKKIKQSAIEQFNKIVNTVMNKTKEINNALEKTEQQLNINNNNLNNVQVKTAQYNRTFNTFSQFIMGTLEMNKLKAIGFSNALNDCKQDLDQAETDLTEQGRGIIRLFNNLDSCNKSIDKNTDILNDINATNNETRLLIERGLNICTNDFDTQDYTLPLRFEQAKTLLAKKAMNSITDK